jgi:GT2 family glycosyltransferase
MDLSIIIVNFNTCKLLRDNLNSVFANTKDLSYEVIVVDNASTDNSAEMVKAEFAKVSLIENKTNVGFAAANNQGIAKARGKYLLLLNSDTIILDDVIARSVEFADEHPDAAVVGCRVLNPDRTVQSSCFMFPSALNMFLSCTYLYRIFPKNRFFARERMGFLDPNLSVQVDVVSGCFMLIRRQTIEQVGFMDEDFFMYCEETDLCYRLKKAGWKVMYAPVGSIIHFGGQSTEQIRTDMLVQLRLSILRFIHKHKNKLSYVTACILTILFFAVRIPVWIAAAGTMPKKRTQALIKMRAYTTGVTRVINQCSIFCRA